MENLTTLVALSLSILFSSGVYAATFTIENNCQYTVWPAIAGNPQPSTTGFELVSKSSTTLNIPRPWSGQIWGRIDCAKDASEKFTCVTGDCGSGQVQCNGASAVPPATLVEFTLGQNGGKDIYDVNIFNGFNVDILLTPQGGPGDCLVAGCAGLANSNCPRELVVKGPNDKVVACKSGCLAFKTPQECCTGDYATRDKCKPTASIDFFKFMCRLAFTYPYDDETGKHNCTGGDINYQIKFCPS